MKVRRKPSFAKFKAPLVRYLLTELEKTAGPDYHPAARAALLDVGREWLLHAEGITALTPLEVLEGLRREVGQEARPCPACGKYFNPSPWHIKRQDYCSIPCRKLATEVRRKKRREEQRQALPHRCACCSKPLENRRLNARYCSSSCKNKQAQKRKKDRIREAGTEEGIGGT